MPTICSAIAAANRSGTIGDVLLRVGTLRIDKAAPARL